MSLFGSSFDADHNGRTYSYLNHSLRYNLPSLDSDRVFAVLWTAKTEPSNDVHFSIAVHQNTSIVIPQTFMWSYIS